MELSGGGSLIGLGFRLSNRPLRKCVVNREQGRWGGGRDAIFRFHTISCNFGAGLFIMHGAIP